MNVAVQLVSAQQDVKQAVAAKDAALNAQEDQICSLQQELNATKEELDVTRDGLNQATMELENVRSLSGVFRIYTKQTRLCSRSRLPLLHVNASDDFLSGCCEHCKFLWASMTACKHPLPMQVQAVIQTRLGRQPRSHLDRSVSRSSVQSEGQERGNGSNFSSPRDHLEGDNYPVPLSETISSPTHTTEHNRYMWLATARAREDCTSVVSSQDAAEDAGVGQVPSLGPPTAGVSDQCGSFRMRSRR